MFVVCCLLVLAVWFACCCLFVAPCFLALCCCSLFVVRCLLLVVRCFAFVLLLFVAGFVFSDCFFFFLRVVCELLFFVVGCL